MRKAMVLLVAAMLVAVGIVGILVISLSQDDATSEWELVDSDSWVAEDGKTYELEMISYFNGNEGLIPDGTYIQSLAYRIYPGTGTNFACDRFYTAEGNGTGFSPYGLYAYDPETGGNQWIFESDSRISTSIRLNNFGNLANVTMADLRIFFGCKNGKICVLEDVFIDPAWGPSAPTGNNVWSYALDGEVKGIAFYDQRGTNQSDMNADYTNITEIRDWFDHNPFNSHDMFFASTANGTLYAFQGPAREWNRLTNMYNITRPTLLWSKAISDFGLTAPTVSEAGLSVYVCTEDGLLYGLDALTGQMISTWNDEPYRITDGFISTAPIAMGRPPVVYASTNDGFVHCIWGLNKTVKSGWTHIENNLLTNGFQLERDGKPDGGNLTDISILPDGSYILVGSDTGFVYSININTGNCIFAFDTRIGTQETEVNVMPYYDWQFSRYLFIAARHLNNTAEDPSDDFTILYCLSSENNSTVIWRLVKEGIVEVPPICFINNNHIGSKADVIFSTTIYDRNYIPIAGKMYSYSVSGRIVEVED